MFKIYIMFLTSVIQKILALEKVWTTEPCYANFVSHLLIYQGS